jgi:peptide/nickel transport system permease protein
MLLFFLVEVGSGDITVKILGIESTPEQRASYRAQLGLTRPAWQRYLDWLVGNDWQVEKRVVHDLVTLPNPRTQEMEWWALVNGQPTRWEMKEGTLTALERQQDGSAKPLEIPPQWTTNAKGETIFWGVNTNNTAVMWVRGGADRIYARTKAGGRWIADGPRHFIPLTKGLIRGDAGESLQTGRPVAATLDGRIRNTVLLAAAAFLVVMPLALFLGILAGINQGKILDRIISITSLSATATPDFVIGILLILVLGLWLKLVPPVSIFLSDDAIFRQPQLLILPALTLTAVELGYVARMMRASMIEVMRTPYIRTAVLKGVPRWRVVVQHAVRNALLAPITVIMLHVNWLIGGVVVVETVFGYPGLGKYIYDSAIFGDFNAIEAATMLTVAIAAGTRLLGDLAYTLLNPRIRYGT